MVNSIERICERLGSMPAGNRVSFEKFIKNKGPILNYGDFLKRNCIDLKGRLVEIETKIPFSPWYFRYIEKTNGDWALPYLGLAEEFGIRNFSFSFSTSASDVCSIRELSERVLSQRKILEEDSNNIVLPLNSYGDMYFEEELIARDETPSNGLVNLSGMLDNTRGLIIPKKYIAVDLFIAGADFVSYGHGCFMTTACTSARGLPRDCIQLNTLRGLRDRYLLGSEEGRILVGQYYATAPQIVRVVKQSPDSRRLLEVGYKEIERAVRLTLSGDFENATKHYIKTMLNFRNHCDLSEISEFRQST